MRARLSRACAMLRYLFHRAAIEREMDDEYRSHIQHRADDLERRGHDVHSFTRILVSYRSDTTGLSFPGAAPLGDYLAYARTIRSLSSITGWQHVQLSLFEGARPMPGALVTCRFFDVYGPVRPI